MAWLLAHMWAALIGVAVFGLLLGWSIRGMLLVGRMRRAVVERDVTQTELEQAKEEIESLYAAQRGQPVGNTNAREAQAEQTVKMQRLTDELARAKSELDALKAKADEALVSGAKAAGAAGVAAGGTLASVGGATDPNPALVWRNRHLESRVRHLEALVGEGGEAAASAPTGEAAPVMAAAAVASESDAAKAEWQKNFLKQRVEALENELAKAKAPAPAPSGRKGNGDAEEELARLRWRNRFLEGRLAYFEGDQDAAEEGAEAEAEETAASEPVAEIVAEPMPLADLPETDIQPEADIEPEIEPEPETELAEAEAQLSEDEPAADDFSEAEEPVEDAPVIEAPVELAADPDAEPDVPPFEIMDRFADPQPTEPEEESHDAELTPVEDELAEDYADEAEESEESRETDLVSAEEASQAILAALELTDAADASEADEETDLTEADADETEDDTQAEAEADDEPAGVQPMALDKPVANAPDDLTVIGGIGPKIQEVLNAMGIWHYDQIAAWSPENITWVDHELNFSGRIVREGWVQQAAILAGDTIDEDA
ncbi:hypothetical protein [Hyphomonas sp.]|uniref:hypothetical protein n=1 Tax=Hyphomonas sp. TaxID=87 RepID=UPI0030019634